MTKLQATTPLNTPAINISIPSDSSTPTPSAKDASSPLHPKGPNHPQGSGGTMQSRLKRQISGLFNRNQTAQSADSDKAGSPSTQEAFGRRAVELSEEDISLTAFMIKEFPSSLGKFSIDKEGMKKYANEFHQKIPNTMKSLVQTAYGTSNAVKLFLGPTEGNAPLNGLTLGNIIANHMERFEEVNVGYLLNTLAGNAAYHKVLLETGYTVEDAYVFKQRLSLLEGSGMSQEEKEQRINKLKSDSSNKFPATLETIRKDIHWLEARLKLEPMKEVKTYYDGFLEALRKANGVAVAGSLQSNVEN